MVPFRRRNWTASLQIWFMNLIGFLCIPSSAPYDAKHDHDCILFGSNKPQESCIPPRSFLPFELYTPGNASLESAGGVGVLEDLIDSLFVMQSEYFAAWIGTWPTAIDWTAAVMGTHVSAALSTISRSLSMLRSASASGSGSGNGPLDWRDRENLINTYFAQMVGFYFGQNAFEIRNEAYDDILWVVLGWLETTNLISVHSSLHFSNRSYHEAARSNLPLPWHGNTWIPSFAHRARIFWELGSRGWDTRLCGGGMLWNPRLLPYKNAITNELWISASASMYLYFPGDNNSSPFTVLPSGNHRHPDRFLATNREDIPYPSAAETEMEDPQPPRLTPPAPAPPSRRDRRFLDAALAAHRWLSGSNMTNALGLYADGFHIRGLRSSNNTRCDERSEAVYTYNQGVVLTGLRGLWTATGGDPGFLAEGHELVQNVVRATGWDLQASAPMVDEDADGEEQEEAEGAGTEGRREDEDNRGNWDRDELKKRDASKPKRQRQQQRRRQKPRTRLPRWRGLGRSGVLEESCDATAECSQDGQTFKGIFFHHLAAFCAPLKPPHLPPPPRQPPTPSSSSQEIPEPPPQPQLDQQAFEAVAAAHSDACAAYAAWVGRNARAALATRDARGRFGTWWNAHLVADLADDGKEDEGDAEVPGWLRAEWERRREEEQRGAFDYRNKGVPGDDELWVEGDDGPTTAGSAFRRERPAGTRPDDNAPRPAVRPDASTGRDPNERGRGRTIETQGGGLAVLRAWFSLTHGL